MIVWRPQNCLRLLETIIEEEVTEVAVKPKLDEKTAELTEAKKELTEATTELTETKTELQQTNGAPSEKDNAIRQMEAELEALRKKLLENN